MIIEEQDVELIIGALDSLGVALADHGHKWTDGEREIYERSLSLLRGQRPCEGCGKPSTHSDSEGIPLCEDCFNELPPIDEADES